MYPMYSGGPLSAQHTSVPTSVPPNAGLADNNRIRRGKPPPSLPQAQNPGTAIRGRVSVRNQEVRLVHEDVLG